MQYFTFMATDTSAEPYRADDDNIAEWVEQTIANGTLVDGDRLEPRENAKTVRVRNGELLVTDGPFTESKEWVNGWGVMEFTDLDQAIEIMAQHPVARFGQVEIRPFMADDDTQHERVDAKKRKFMMFVAVDPQPDTDQAPEPDIDEWVASNDASGARIAGHQLAYLDDATTIRKRDGEVLVTDGPFTESKEWIAGYDLLDVDTIDDAIAIAAAHPMARGGRIEVRALWPLELN
jgi:hypothetical protein